MRAFSMRRRSNILLAACLLLTTIIFLYGFDRVEAQAGAEKWVLLTPEQQLVVAPFEDVSPSTTAFVARESPLQLSPDHQLQIQESSKPEDVTKGSLTASAKSDEATAAASIATPYIRAIMDPLDTSLPRMTCPTNLTARYEGLRAHSVDSDKPKYFFALDIHENAALLPRLMGSIVEAMRFLGPMNCVLSIVEGRSTDATFAILSSLQPEIEALGANYILTQSTIDPSVGARIDKLAELRNLALAPLHQGDIQFSDDTIILFINDVAICTEDILELILQKHHLGADQVCALDWTWAGEYPTFYDVWVSRGMTGDTYFEIMPDGNWDYAWALFWNDERARNRLMANLPFQVFSCWNGATAFSARPLMDGSVKFRGPVEGKCFQGEPQLFASDMWAAGYGKIAVVPSISLAYDDQRGQEIKEMKGWASSLMNTEGPTEVERIEWELEPPEAVKCLPNGFVERYWVPWNESVVTSERTEV